MRKRPFLISVLLLSASIFLNAENSWLQVETPHYRFIYKPASEKALNEVTGFAEESYTVLSKLFDELPQKIDCVIFGETDQSNGYFMPLPPMHMALYTASPTWPWMGARSESWLKLLFIHELIHHLHLTAKEGLFAFASRIFGRSMTSVPAAFLTAWMVEGAAVLGETEYSEGGRGRNPFFEMLYKAPILEGAFFSLEQADYSSVFPPSGRHYVAGYLLVSYIYSHYGIEALVSIHESFLRFPPFGLGRAVREVTGKSLTEIFQAMKEELRDHYEKELVYPEGEWIGPRGYADYYLPFKTEQGIYVYRSTFDKPPAIVGIDPDTGEEEEIIDTVLTDYASISSDSSGDLLVFSSYQSLHSSTTNAPRLSVLYSFDRKHGRYQRISNEGHLYHPALTPKGDRLFAVRRRGAYSSLVEIDMENGRVETVFEEEKTRVLNPVVSPDGSQIAFVRNKEGMQDIWVGNIDTTGRSGAMRLKARPITGPDRYGEYFPRFTDAGGLIYSSDRTGALSLYRYSFKTQTSSFLFREPVAAYAGTYWDDTLFYSSYTHRGYRLKRIEIEESLVYKPPLTEGPGIVPWSTEAGPSKGEMPSTVDPAEKQSTETVKGPSPYHDLPYPRLWLPYPSVIATGVNPIDLGIGFLLLGESTLGMSSWYIQTALHPSVMQLAGDASLRVGNSPLSLSYRFLTDYAIIGGFAVQSSSHTLRTALDVFTLRDRGALRSVGISLGLRHRRELYRPFQDFAFRFSPSPEEGIEEIKGLEALSGIGYWYYGQSSAGDLFTPWFFRTEVSSAIPLPVYRESELGLRSVLYLDFSLPTFSHHRLKFGSKIGFMTYNQWSGGAYRLAGPRALTAPIKSSEGSFLLSLDYQFTLAILDQPLFFGMNVQGFGAGLYVEATGEWSSIGPELRFDRDLFAGIELHSIWGVNTIRFPIIVGMEARLSPLFGRTFDLDRDIGLYFSFDFGQFLYLEKDNFGSL